MNVKLWFLQLSGWWVFLTIVTLTFTFAMALSVLMTWLSRFSVFQTAVFAIVGVSLVGFGLLGLLAFLSRF